MPQMKMPPAILLALTLGPALAIGMTLWLVNDMIPDCTLTEHQRLTSPDSQVDLVIFSRACGPAEPNSQAALVSPGEAVTLDTASFVAVGSEADLQPRWDAYGNIELALPIGAEVYHQNDSAGSISIIYR